MRIVKKIALCAAVAAALAACGSGSDGSNGSSNSNTGSTNHAPTNVNLTSVTAASPTAINVTWNIAHDDLTPANLLIYEVHVFEGNNPAFIPSNSTFRFVGKNVTSAQIANLKSSKLYTVKLIVKDVEGYLGLATTSSGLTVTTPASPNQAPTNVYLIAATAVSPTEVSVSWGSANDDHTPFKQLFYELYLIEGNDPAFSSSNGILKYSGIYNSLVNSTQISNLKASTLYTLKLVVSDDQQLKTISSGLTVKTANILVLPPLVLNDTGITVCANDNTIFDDCLAASLGGWFGLNQDGEVGRDFLATHGLLSKIGAGNGGFDFTKISAAGQALATNADIWNCVKDNVTGLMWEVKTNDGGLRDWRNDYQWYNPDPNTNADFIGSASHSNNTYAFIQAVNQQGLCGHNDWRLPSMQELNSIVDYGKTNPAIDSAYFPYTQGSWYWPSSPAISSKSTKSTYAHYVNFQDGSVGNDADINFYVRLVRSAN